MDREVRVEGTREAVAVAQIVDSPIRREAANRRMNGANAMTGAGARTTTPATGEQDRR